MAINLGNEGGGDTYQNFLAQKKAQNPNMADWEIASEWNRTQNDPNLLQQYQQSTSVGTQNGVNPRTVQSPLYGTFQDQGVQQADGSMLIDNRGTMGGGGITDVINTSNQQQLQQQLGKTPQEQAMIDAQKAALQQPTEIGAQGINALYPGLTQPINVGNYSGSIVGSNSIYVPSGNIMPLDPILAQNKANEAAKIAEAQAKAKLGKDFDPKLKGFKDPRFNETLMKDFNNVTQGYQQEIQDVYGDDYRFVLENPQDFKEGREYLQKVKAMENLVERGDYVIDQLADIRASVDAGEKVYSDETLQTLNEYEDLMNDYENGDYNALLKLENTFNRLEGGKNLDNYFKEQGTLKQIQASVIERSGIKASEFEGFAKLSSSKKKEFDENIDKLAKEWTSRNGPFRDEFNKGLVTEESIKNRLRGYLQNEYTSGATSLTKTDLGTSGGSAKISDLSNVTGTPNLKTFTNSEGRDYNIKTSEEIKLPTTKHKVSTSGLKTIDDNNRLVPLTGVNSVEITSLNNLNNETLEQGQSRFEDFKGSEKVPIAIVRYDIEEPVMIEGRNEAGQIAMMPDPTGKKVTKTISAPVVLDETLIDAIRTDSKSLKLEQGFIDEASKLLKKDIGNSGKSSNQTKNINGVEYTKEELINFAKEAGKTTKEAEDLWNQQ